MAIGLIVLGSSIAIALLYSPYAIIRNFINRKKNKTLPGWNMVYYSNAYASPDVIWKSTKYEWSKNASFFVPCVQVNYYSTDRDDTERDKIEKSIEKVFEWEKNNSNDWKLFLYNLCLFKLKDIKINSKNYTKSSLGSWSIKRNKKIIYYDGFENRLGLRETTNLFDGK